MLTTISKAGAVLDLFTLERPEWGVTEVAARLGTSKTGAHALLSTLADVGLVQRTSSSRYRLGWRILALSRTLVESTDFRAFARARMQHLAARYGHTLHLAVFDGTGVVYLEKAEGARSETIGVTGVGMSMAAHCSAVGKVLLSATDPRVVDEVTERTGMARRTRHTITSTKLFARELATTRARGYAHDLQEGVDGVCCVAAPIHDRHRVVRAAMSVSVSPRAFRRDPDGYRKLVLAATGEVSRYLGAIQAGA